MSDQEIDFYDDADLDEPQAVRPARARHGRDAVSALLGAAFDAAMPSRVRRRLRHGQALVMVLQVPTAGWISPAKKYFAATFGDRWNVHERDGADRRRNSSVGSEEVASELMRGLCVLGISFDVGLLPTALTSAADLVVRIGPPDGVVLRTAIARFAGRNPGELEGGIAVGLDFHEIVSAFRPGTGARKIVERLRAASSARAVAPDRIPDLDTAVEFGEAQIWGKNLARDIRAYRAGCIDWRQVDRGICLHSPPGMGKSLFPIIVAKACEVPLVSTSIGELFASGPGYLDSVIKNLRAAFARASALACPCSILHIDEIDALPNRETLSDRGREWWSALVADALTLLDSALAGRNGVVVIGSTNAIDRVDPALLRPGRLEKVVEIKRPDLAGTLNMLNFHLDGQLVGEDISEIASLLEGATGAEIMYAVRLAQRSARNAERSMTVADLRGAVLPVEDIAPGTLFRMAVHEAAHAVVAAVIPVGVLKYVVLRAQGHVGGRTVLDFPARELTTRPMIEDQVVVGLAARAAERHLLGSVSTGAGGSLDSDLGRCTLMIAGLHASFGMGENVAFLGADGDLLSDLRMNRELRERVEAHLRKLDARAAKLVANNSEAILNVAQRLAVKRYMGGDEVRRIVAEASGAPHRLPPDP